MPSDKLPPTGAWRPSDAPGEWVLHRFARDRPMSLDGGGTLRDVAIAYETWGELNPEATNAVLVCHALTGDSHASGRTPTMGWWHGLIGPGRPVDTDRWFVVCCNVLGGCQGSTGPASIDPATGAPYGPSFPQVTIRDMVRTQAAAADHLGVDRWASVIGGSMGGMQVLEWAITYPDRVRSIVPIATCAHATAQQISWGSVGRQAIRLDPGWQGGDYYDSPPGKGPHRGLSIARQVAQITYRSDDVFTDRFGRQLADARDGFALDGSFEVERYLDHHGAKLVRRFDANSYLVLTKAMDLHDVSRGRGSVASALARVRVPSLVVGISSDTLYWPWQQQLLRDVLASEFGDCTYTELDSPHGHDAFLIDVDQLGAAVQPFLDRVATP